MKKYFIALLSMETILFVLAALLHSGIYPFTLVSEKILSCLVINAGIAIILAIATYGLATRKLWGWIVSVVAQIVMVSGVIVAVAALLFQGKSLMLLHYGMYGSMLILGLASFIVLFHRDSIRHFVD